MFIKKEIQELVNNLEKFQLDKYKIEYNKIVDRKKTEPYILGGMLAFTALYEPYNVYENQKIHSEKSKMDYITFDLEASLTRGKIKRITNLKIYIKKQIFQVNLIERIYIKKNCLLLLTEDCKLKCL